MLRLFGCAAAVAFLVVSCSSEKRSPQPVAQADALPKTSLGPKTDAGPPPADPVADPFAEEYIAIRSQITRWDGDTAKLDDAKQRIMGILAKDRDYAPAYVALGRIEALKAHEEGEMKPEGLDRGTKFVNHALKLDPNLFEAHRTAAWIATVGGDFDIAEESLRKAEALRPGDQGLNLVRAYVALYQEEILKGLDFARSVVADSTDDDDRADAYRVLTILYESGLHLEEADGAYKELLKLRPEWASAHGSYAALLLHRDDVDGAIREAEAAANIRKYPAGKAILARSYLRKAQELWDANKIRESAAFIQKVGSLADDDANVSFALGQFYEGAAIRGRDPSMRKKALASYKRALEIDPRHMEAERAVNRLDK